MSRVEWNRVTADLASTGEGGWRRVSPAGRPASLLGTAVVLNAALEDAIYTLPLAHECEGTLFYFKRVDPPNTMFVAEVVPADTSNTIDDAASYPFTVQWQAAILASDGDRTFFVFAEYTP